MSKKLLKTLDKITESSGSTKITLFTPHLKIDGNVFKTEGRCEECNEDYLTLENALICRLEDYCVCDDTTCECDDYICFRYDWLNVNIDAITAFSIIS